MFSSIRDRFGAAGLIVAIVALVAALAGGAYAASGGLSGKQKKEVTKIAKQYAGKQGPAGATGPAGSNGAKGDNGSAGKDGTNGANGTNGTNGISPVGTSFSGAKAPCTAGGIEYKGATTNLVCNGATGFTETLPKGKTETGTWGMFVPAGGGGNLTSISFAIPLVGPLDGSKVLDLPLNYSGEDEATEEHENCPGTAINPQAKEGFLCVYTGTVAGPPVLETEGIETIFDPGAGGFAAGAAKGGAGLILKEEAGGVIAGTFAVTGS